jgi:hypothetical protein
MFDFTAYCLQLIEPTDSITYIQRVTRMYLTTAGITYREFCHCNDSTDISYATLSSFLLAELDNMAVTALSYI